MIEPVEPFKSHCEAEFEFLASNDPAKLVALLEEGNLPDSLLTFAAEYAGEIERDVPGLKENLLRLLEHEKAGVREGAIYGLAGIYERYPEVVQCIIKHCNPKFELSLGVRMAAHGFRCWVEET